ncbi:MAG: hypothetical protein EZS28_000478 [Streblomastix strix]|uniref:RRM domain-containing protein n=1 Tax=Streblomastix strix TaxID=222440 RepID=A0A5J4XBU8_9EUKA|nr:MAG: hypothetical protein EZS28_000478 [Streblomastix strix]
MHSLWDVDQQQAPSAPPIIHRAEIQRVQQLASATTVLRQNSRKLYVSKLQDLDSVNDLMDCINVAVIERKLAQTPTCTGVQYVAGQPFAFVEFATSEDTTNALMLNGLMFNHQQLIFKRPATYSPLPPLPEEIELKEMVSLLTKQAHIQDPKKVDFITGQQVQQDMMKRVFIGGLPVGVNANEIYQILSPLRPIEFIEIPNDPVTCSSQGFAFFELMDGEKADAAVSALDGKEFVWKDGNKHKLIAGKTNVTENVYKTALTHESSSLQPIRISAHIQTHSSSQSTINQQYLIPSCASILGRIHPLLLSKLSLSVIAAVDAEPQPTSVLCILNARPYPTELIEIVSGITLDKEKEDKKVEQGKEEFGQEGKNKKQKQSIKRESISPIASPSHSHSHYSSQSQSHSQSQHNSHSRSNSHSSSSIKHKKKKNNDHKKNNKNIKGHPQNIHKNKKGQNHKLSNRIVSSDNSDNENISLEQLDHWCIADVIEVCKSAGDLKETVALPWPDSHAFLQSMLSAWTENNSGGQSMIENIAVEIANLMNIYAKFSSIESAKQAIANISGKCVRGRRLVVIYVSEQAFIHLKEKRT